MSTFLKRLFCAHDWKPLGNIYGDAIIIHGWNRSEWKCKRCGKYKLCPFLIDWDNWPKDRAQ